VVLWEYMNDLKNTMISISSGTIVRAILWGLLFYILFVIKDLVLVVLAAVVIASSIEPATKWFNKNKIGRLPAVILVYVLIALLLAGIFFFFLPLLLNETSSYLSNLPETVNLSDLWNPLQESNFFNGPAVQGIPQSFSVKELLTNVRGILSGTSSGFFKTASTIFGGALSFVLIIVLSFYLAVQEDGVANFLRVITPIKSQKYVVDLWKRSQLKIGYWMQGQLLLGVIVGVLVYLGLTILGVKHALLLACLAALFELIPVFGPVLSAIPAVAVGAVDGGVTSALLIAGLYLIIQQFENHLIYPLVVRKIVGISPILVILSLVIGAKLAGFLGILLSVPLAAVFMEYFHDVEKHKISQGGQPVSN
jgi:predicted PurR-regulated permease PerM